MFKASVLLVDDTAEHRELFKEALSPLRLDVVEASTGQDAIALAREGDFALALIDIRMKGMDGFEIASLLRQEPNTSALPVLFVTGNAEDPQLRRMAYRMGAAGVLINAPTDAEVLRHKVRAFVNLYRARKEKQLRIDSLDEELKQTQSELSRNKNELDVVRRQATNDLLTGLPNRLLFEDRINGALIRSRRTQSRLGLVYIDLDGFKPINERHGHAAGDEVLATVARRLVEVVRASDTVARLGSDEFAIVLEGLDSKDSADHVGQKILKAFADPIAIRPAGAAETIMVRMSASIGMALCPEHADNRNDLLMLADMAMYAVKRDGGGLRVASAQPTSQNVINAEEFRRRQAQ